MARRRTPNQARAAIRQAQSKQKRAVDEYNRKVRSRNTKRKRAINDLNRTIDNYNREVRAYNGRRKQAINRYNQAVREYNRQPAQIRTTTRTTHIQSVQTLQDSFARLENSPASQPHHHLVDLSERETANSANAGTALLAPDDPDRTASDTEVDDLRSTTITSELTTFSEDLDGRWRGALFALHPDNPDAARHFCTSARETISSLLLAAAPDDELKAANPNYFKTPQGDISRRARIHYCLNSHGEAPTELVDFVEADIDNIISLFDDFNSGTHGESGRFPIPQLIALKTRVEDAIKFVYQLTREVVSA